MNWYFIFDGDGRLFKTTCYPAGKLFEKNGFVYAGDIDLGLNIGEIPAFSLYELNL